ncbi:hypothetical protein HY622_01595 [Candidatus Uhrbacteria bacterium]|nr:hypothetical protein [Candidatus Uhrbacteria bacterium]
MRQELFRGINDGVDLLWRSSSYLISVVLLSIIYFAGVGIISAIVKITRSLKWNTGIRTLDKNGESYWVRFTTAPLEKSSKRYERR